MAVVNSLAIGKSVKSAGNLTYKTVRGRCIASQRITQNKSNTNAQQIARNNFKQASKIITIFQAWIDMAFEKSKYGSARNEFLKTNKTLLENVDINTDFILGATNAGNWFASMCGPEIVTDGSQPFFSLFTKGSASGVFVEGTPATGWSGSVQGCQSIQFNFVSPIISSNVRVGAVLFFKNSNQVIIKTPKSLAPGAGGYKEEITNGVIITMNSDDQGQTLNSFFIDGYDPVLKPDAGGDAVYAIPVVLVNNKIVSLDKLFYATTV